MRGNRKFFYALLVFVAGSSYGFIVPVVKAATAQGLSVPGFLPSIYLAAFLMSALLAAVQRAKLPGRKGLLQLASLGVCTSLTSSCYYSAVALLPSAVALTLLFQYVWVGVAIDCALRRKLPARWTAIAIGVVLAGTLFAAGIFEGDFAALDPFGVACGLASAVFYALFLFLSGRIEVESSASVRTMLVGASGFLVTIILNPGYFSTWFLDGAVWPWAALLAVIGILLPVGLIGIAGPHLTVGTVNVMASSELPIGVLTAWAFLGDAPSPLALFGVALVLAGILLAQKDPRTE